MANYMKLAARILGVEIGEEFNVVFGSSISEMKYRFTDSELQFFEKDCGIWFKSHALVSLLLGSVGVVKNHWIPKNGEEVYIVYEDGSVSKTFFFENHMRFIVDYKIGNCYRTREEAEADAEKWKAWCADLSQEKVI